MSSSLNILIARLMDAIRVHGNRTQVLSIYQELLEAYGARCSVVEKWRQTRDGLAAGDIAKEGKARSDSTYDQEIATTQDLAAYKLSARELETITVYLQAAALFSAPAHL